MLARDGSIDSALVLLFLNAEMPLAVDRRGSIGFEPVLPILKPEAPYEVEGTMFEDSLDESCPIDLETPFEEDFGRFTDLACASISFRSSLVLDVFLRPFPKKPDPVLFSDIPLERIS